MSIQYMVLGFKLTAFKTWVSSNNHYTRAPAQSASFCLLSFFKARSDLRNSLRKLQ